jgi:hypothetical protein
MAKTLDDNSTAKERKAANDDHHRTLISHTLDAAEYGGHGHAIGRQGKRGHTMVPSDAPDAGRPRLHPAGRASGEPAEHIVGRRWQRGGERSEHIGLWHRRQKRLRVRIGAGCCRPAEGGGSAYSWFSFGGSALAFGYHCRSCPLSVWETDRSGGWFCQSREEAGSKPSRSGLQGGSN